MNKKEHCRLDCDNIDHMESPEIELNYQFFTCEICNKKIPKKSDRMYPHGHHGEPVQCLGCFSARQSQEPPSPAPAGKGA